MATQRVTMAKIAGRSAAIVAQSFRRWQETRQEDEFPAAVRDAVDTFADQLRANAHVPPVVFFAEWVDLWSMGDLIPGLGDERAVVIGGTRYQACCHQPPVSFKTTTIVGEPSQESQWLKRRLEEATDAWEPLARDAVIVVLRESLGALVTDEELADSLDTVPSWLDI